MFDFWEKKGSLEKLKLKPIELMNIYKNFVEEKLGFKKEQVASINTTSFGRLVREFLTNKDCGVEKKILKGHAVYEFNFELLEKYLISKGLIDGETHEFIETLSDQEEEPEDPLG